MTKKTPKQYSVPVVEVLNARVEKGFEGSVVRDQSEILENLTAGSDISNAQWT
jgi:hypothetical protein